MKPRYNREALRPRSSSMEKVNTKQNINMTADLEEFWKSLLQVSLKGLIWQPELLEVPYVKVPKALFPQNVPVSEHGITSRSEVPAALSPPCLTFSRPQKPSLATIHRPCTGTGCFLLSGVPWRDENHCTSIQASGEFNSLLCCPYLQVHTFVYHFPN